MSLFKRLKKLNRRMEHEKVGGFTYRQGFIHPGRQPYDPGDWYKLEPEGSRAAALKLYGKKRVRKVERGLKRLGF